MDTIHLVNAADALYVPHTAAMLHSLFHHNPGERFHVHFLHRPDLDPAEIRRLATLCGRHHAGFSSASVAREQLAGLPITPPFTEEAWYRVLLPDLLPQVDRCLWLDADVIVLQPLRALWETDLGGTPIAACPNAVMADFADVIGGLRIADRRDYFNSGVLVLDLARMRTEGAVPAMRAAAERFRDRIRFADQDVLNVVYHRRYTRLRLCWNVLTQSYVNVPETVRVHGRGEFDEAMAQPRILHFTGLPYCKPWRYTCSHPMRDHYRHHRLAAGWPLEFPDKSLRTRLARSMSLRLRETLKALRQRRFRQVWSYYFPW
jgi:lipopolysaccharide biosynthesis glycosyltransferase